MKRSFRTIVLLFVAFTASAPLVAEDFLDIVEKAQKTILQKYPDESSIARKMAIEELEKIARSDKSDEEKISAILAKFPDQATEMKKAAEQGDAEAQFELGRCFYYGNGVEKDYTEAFKWFKKSAEQGNAKAQSNLGICYHNGIGIEKDIKESIKWTRKAAEQGDAKAQSNLGANYYSGDGVNKDYTEAFKWFKKAAEQDDAGAQFNLGLCYYEGNGVSRNESEATKWFRKAAGQGNEEAKKKIATIEKANNEKTKKANEEALREQRELVGILQFLGALSSQQSQQRKQSSERQIVCTHCGGLGYTFDGVMGTRKSCWVCGGTGYTSSSNPMNQPDDRFGW